MNTILVTCRKELLSYFTSPVSYVIAVLFYTLHGIMLAGLAIGFWYGGSDADLFPTSSYSLPSTFIVVVLVPAILTMRCFAEELRSGSIETLLTAPVRDGDLVVGKWLAATLFYGVLWLPSVGVLWLLGTGWFFDLPTAMGPVLCAYLGMFLISALMLAFGCLASSLTDNVLLAALLGIVFNFSLMFGAQLLYGAVQPYLDNDYVRLLYEKLWVFDHFRNWFARGLLDTSQIVFYLGGIAFFLFLCTLRLSARRLA